MSKNSGQTLYRQELRQRILQAAMGAFLEKGIRAVRMDDIAQRLSISKRTLYEIYSNKEELLLEGMMEAEREFDRHMESFSQSAGHNVMDVLIEFYNIQVRYLSKASPLYFDEVLKYRRVHRYIQEKRRERDRRTYDFFERGVREGFFRADFNYRIVVQTAREAVHGAMRSRLYQEHGIQSVFKNIILLFIRGICTVKGLETLERAL